MSVRVHHPGQWATIQDTGRPGFGSIGVPVCGAADSLSLRIGNRLVGNPDSSAAIEMTLVGCTLEFLADAVIAVTGADAPCTLAHLTGALSELAGWTPYGVHAGERLRIGAARTGARMYLCIRGGFDALRMLGSRSVHVPSGMGGRLAPGNVLAIGPSSPEWQPHRVGAAELKAYRGIGAMHTAAVVRGTHADLFAPGEIERMVASPWTVSPRWDRTGLRLQGQTLTSPGDGRIQSTAAWYGCVQVPQDGSPILLGADAPTTGGYPIALSVATVSLAMVGQLRGGSGLSFRLVEPAEAVHELRAREQALDDLLPSAISRVVDLNCDLGEDPEAVHNGRDARLAAICSSVNIACGGHAGDETTMRAMVRTARRHGAAVGAHPSYPDRAGFGRARMELSPAELDRTLRAQVRALLAVCSEEGMRLRHIKPHGALYHDVCRAGPELHVLMQVSAEEAPGAALVLLAGSPGAALAAERGADVQEEVFADRRYSQDGGLVPRHEPGALLTEPDAAAEQALRLVGAHTLAQGRADRPPGTVCIHSDTPGSPAIAGAVRSALERSGFTVAPPRPRRIRWKP